MHKPSYHAYYVPESDRSRRNSDATLIEHNYHNHASSPPPAYGRQRRAADDEHYSSQDHHSRSKYAPDSGLDHHGPHLEHQSRCPARQTSYYDKHAPDSARSSNSRYLHHSPNEKRSSGAHHSLQSETRSRNDHSPPYRHHPPSSSTRPGRPCIRQSPRSGVYSNPHSNAMNDDDGYDHAHESRSQATHAYIRDHLPPLPQAQPHFPPPGSVPFLLPGFYPYPPPQKEKKRSMMERVKQAFEDLVADEVIPSLPPSQQPSRHHSVVGTSAHNERKYDHASDRAKDNSRHHTVAGSSAHNEPKFHASNRAKDNASYSNYGKHNSYGHDDYGNGSPMHHDLSMPYHFVLPLYHHPDKKEKNSLTERVKKAVVEFCKEPPIPSLPPTRPVSRQISRQGYRHELRANRR